MEKYVQNVFLSHVRSSNVSKYSHYTLYFVTNTDSFVYTSCFWEPASLPEPNGQQVIYKQYFRVSSVCVTLFFFFFSQRRFNFGPGSEAIMPEPPLDIWGFQTLCGGFNPSLHGHMAAWQPECCPWSQDWTSSPALPGSAESPCVNVRLSSYSFPSFPLVMCSFMELKPCPSSRNVKLLNCFCWASGENEPLVNLISSAKLS